MPAIETTPELVRDVYQRLERNVEIIRGRLDRPLTYAEKIFLGHLADPSGAELRPGRSYMDTRPDRIAMQDATAQMALLQFMLAGREETAVPTTVHCDHLIQAHQGADEDMETAQVTKSVAPAAASSAADASACARASSIRAGSVMARALKPPVRTRPCSASVSTRSAGSVGR